MTERERFLINFVAVVVSIAAVILFGIFGVIFIICAAAGYGIYSIIENNFETKYYLLLAMILSALLYFLLSYLIFG